MAATYADWRALVEAELKGKPFEKALGANPLYVDAPALPSPVAGSGFKVVMRVDAAAQIAGELADGADGVWLPVHVILSGAAGGVEGSAGAGRSLSVTYTFDVGDEAVAALESAVNVLPTTGDWHLGLDAFTRLDVAGAVARLVRNRNPRATAVRVSTLDVHLAGAPAAFEVAYALATGVAALEALLTSGFSIDDAASLISFQVAVGRDTFGELSKLRALRWCWAKVLTGAGAKTDFRPLVHAVCSERTLTVRDPWVNLLRVTTQMFAGALGGADLLTPQPFDALYEQPGDLGRRTARNTGLVLREESHLGAVADPAAGSYAIDSMTDATARAAWKEFQQLQREGGAIAAMQKNGAALKASWASAKQQPVLGVSDFANLDEKLPGTPAAGHEQREAAAMERLRSVVEKQLNEVVLLTLGTFAESRARVGFATNFFGAFGLRVRETTEVTKARVVCLCGTDEQYVEKAASLVQALKAAGCEKVVLAGRPKIESGADALIYVGVDAVDTMTKLLGVKS